jgi:hypothetical protein
MYKLETKIILTYQNQQNKGIIINGISSFFGVYLCWKLIHRPQIISPMKLTNFLGDDPPFSSFSTSTPNYTHVQQQKCRWKIKLTEKRRKLAVACVEKKRR